jgi:hypothetical protein
MAICCLAGWLFVIGLGRYWFVLSSCYKPMGEEAWLRNQKPKKMPEGKI